MADEHLQRRVREFGLGDHGDAEELKRRLVEWDAMAESVSRNRSHHKLVRAKLAVLNVVVRLPSQVLAAAWLLLLTSIRWWIVNAVGGIWLESSNAPNHQHVFQQYNSRRQQVQMASVAAAIIPPVVWVVDHMFRTLSKTSASP